MAISHYAEGPFDGLRHEVAPRRERRIDWWLVLGLPAIVGVLVALWVIGVPVIADAAVSLMDRIAALSAEQRFVGLVVVVVSCCVLAARTNPEKRPEGPEVDVR